MTQGHGVHGDVGVPDVGDVVSVVTISDDSVWVLLARDGRRKASPACQAAPASTQSSSASGHAAHPTVFMARNA